MYLRFKRFKSVIPKPVLKYQSSYIYIGRLALDFIKVSFSRMSLISYNDLIFTEEKTGFLIFYNASQ